MKLNNAYIIERIFVFIVNFIWFPIALIYIILYYLVAILDYFINFRDKLILNVSHKLFLLCDEKKLIENKRIYNNMSVKALRAFLKVTKNNTIKKLS